MATVARPTIDISQVTEILEIAHHTLRRNRHHDLVQKVTVLQGYLDLSRMNPDRNYTDVIRKAFDDLTALVHLMDEVAEMNRKSLRPISDVEAWQGVKHVGDRSMNGQP